MKRIITILLALTFMLTTMVACGNDDEKNDTGSQDSPSIEQLTSEELDAWGDVQIGIETKPEQDTQTNVSGGSSTSSTASGTVSSDPDEGFLDWVPIR